MSLQRKLETVANIAIIIVALLIGWVVVTKFFMRRTAEPLVPVGKTLALPGVEWQAAERTLVVVLRKGCHLCDDSAQFHRRVVVRANERHVPVIAVLPDPLADAKDYVRVLGLNIADVRHSSMARLHVSRVPSLLLVDRNGRVQQAWSGQLAPPDEDDVLQALGSSGLESRGP